jgi:hypothetical protein
MGCPRCFRDMENLGNVSGWISLTTPPQWDELWVCTHCKVKATLRVRGTPAIHVDVEGYEDVTEEALL